MPLLPSSIRTLLAHARDRASATSANASTSTSADGGAGKKSLLERCIDVGVHTWDLGFTAFGGPPVHFQILQGRFVAGVGWVDEQSVGVHFLVSFLGFWFGSGSIKGYTENECAAQEQEP